MKERLKSFVSALNEICGLTTTIVQDPTGQEISQTKVQVTGEKRQKSHSRIQTERTNNVHLRMLSK